MLQSQLTVHPSKKRKGKKKKQPRCHHAAETEINSSRLTASVHKNKTTETLEENMGETPVYNSRMQQYRKPKSLKKKQMPDKGSLGIFCLEEHSTEGGGALPCTRYNQGQRNLCNGKLPSTKVQRQIPTTGKLVFPQREGRGTRAPIYRH